MYDPATAYTHTLKNMGHPLTTWVRITYANKDEPYCSPCNILLIEIFADEACTKVLTEDDGGKSFTEEQIEALNLTVRVDIDTRTFRAQTTKLLRLAQARAAMDDIKADPSFLLQKQAG